ncbi:ArsR family transcriptional regulator [archaeon]|nr:ArsR family transcriptional regulator [archaeon]
MGKGYSSEQIRQKLILILDGAVSGMSGVEISEKMGISRITMTKYLRIFAAEGLLRQKNIGNVNLWFLEPGQESFTFPDDYFKIPTQYIEYLIKGDESRVYSLIRNCLHSGGLANRLILEVIFPSIDHVEQLYDDAKIGTSEKHFLETIISKSFQIFNHVPVVADPKKNVIVIASGANSRLNSESASAAYHSDGWNVSHLGDMSSAINVLFDLDLQKLIGKIWKQKPGILVITVFAKTTEDLIFFADSINSVKEKYGKSMKLVLCGKVSKKSKIKSDLTSDKIGDILQWSQTVSENIK